MENDSNTTQAPQGDDSDVTWCADRIFRHDVEYIRADRVQILIDALNGLATPCTRADYKR